MKKNLLFAIVIACGFVFFVDSGSAAQFTHYGGGLYGETYSQVNNGVDNVADGPHETAHSTSFAVGSNAGIGQLPSDDDLDPGGIYVKAKGASDGSVYGDSAGPDYGPSVQVMMNVAPEVTSTDTAGHGYALDNASLMEQGVTNGLYFQITAEAGETIGDAVRVDFFWLAMADPLGFGAPDTVINAVFDGGNGLDHIALTLNDYPSSVPGSEIWIHDGLTYDDFGFLVYTIDEDGYFMAQIGDIIGIHMGLSADVALDGQGAANILASQSISLDVSAVPIPAAGWLFAGGIMWLVCVRREFAKIKHR